MKKIILIIIISLAILGGIFLYNTKLNSLQQTISPTPQEQPLIVQVKIVFPDNTISEELEASENETAYSVLKKSAENNQLEMHIKEYDFGVFVESVGDYQSGADMSWIYFVDGQSGDKAADQYQVKPDQVVEWKYIKPSF